LRRTVAAPEWARLCSEDGIPDIWRPAFFDAKRSELELTLPDPAQEIDPGDSGQGVSRPIILFNEFVQTFRRSNFCPRAAAPLFEDFSRRSMRSLISVERDFVRQTASARERTTAKLLGGSHVAVGAQEEIDCLPGLVHGSAEIGPATLDLDEVLSTRHDLPSGRAKRLHRFSNSGT
jgi:hypothetical protein